MLPVVMACVLVINCKDTPGAPKAEVKKPVEYFHVDSATAGTLSGRVAYRGTAPAKVKISMNAEEWCEAAHKNSPAFEEPVLVGKGGALVNAFVYIKSGLEGKTFEPVTDPVRIDQHGCMFMPRVIGLRTGQTLAVTNSDQVSHNIHPLPRNNFEWNQQQSPGAPDLSRRFAHPEVVIPVKCNIHSWMHAYIGVVEHPYFAVTAADGSFQWANVPPGDYEIAVWHEKLGTQEQKVHVDASGRAAVEFQFQ
jgi:hypothetical protein